jgi:hypothetical protein
MKLVFWSLASNDLGDELDVRPDTTAFQYFPLVLSDLRLMDVLTFAVGCR